MSLAVVAASSAFAQESLFSTSKAIEKIDVQPTAVHSVKDATVKMLRGDVKAKVASSYKKSAAVAKAAVEGAAYYSIPAGTFYGGQPEDGSILPGLTVMPAYANLTWQNQTGSWANTFNWEYYDPSGNILAQTAPETFYATTKDLAYQTTGGTVTYVPTLQATGSGRTETYVPTYQTSAGTATSLGTVGISLSNYIEGNPAVGISGYDPQYVYAAYTADEEGRLVSGKRLDASGNALLLVDGLDGFVQAFDKPAKPYFLSTYISLGGQEYTEGGVFFPLQIKAADTDEITVTIYKAERVTLTGQSTSGQTIQVPGVELGEELGHSTKTFADLKSTLSPMKTDATTYAGYATFNKFVKENSLGYESPTSIVVDGEIAVVVSGFESPTVTHFIMFTNEQALDGEKLDEVANSRIATNAFWHTSKMQDQTLCAAYFDNFNFALYVDAAFTYLYSENPNLTIPVAGGKAEVKLDDYYGILNMWKFVCGNKTITIDDNLAGQLNDWLTVTTYQEEVQQSVYSYTFEFEAAALPAGVTGRSATVTFTDGAASQVYTITQGEAGVSVVEGNGNNVAVVDGNFQVTAAKAGLVEVYNVAGQKVAAANVDGTSTIAADGLANGMYIVKFADNSVVKVMK